MGIELNAQEPFYLAALSGELTKRCEKNPRYSLRAFARALDVDIACLSRVLSRRRILTLKTAQKIANNLSFDMTTRDTFLSSVFEQQKVRGFPDSTGQRKVVEPPREIENDLYQIIGDWYHHAILELTCVKGFRSSPRWIASKLNISILEAKLAIKRLLQVGLLVQEKGTLKKCSKALITKDQSQTTPWLKRHQKQLLEKSIFSLENDPIEKRNHTGITMAIDPKKLPKAKKEIAKFVDSLCRRLESGEQTHVYQLSVCLFPIYQEKVSS